MKDKIADLIYAFQDNKSKFMPIFKLVMTLLGLFLILGLFLGWFKEKPVENSVIEGLYEEKENFEYLSFKDVSKNEKFFLPSIDLLLVNPNMDTDEAEELLAYVDMKMRKEANLLEKELSGIKIDLYRRNIEYELGLSPSGTYSYLVNGSAADTMELEKLPKKEESYVKSFDYEELSIVPDLEFIDEDDIVIETIEVPKYLSDSDYLKLLKLNEYYIIFESMKSAIGFYVYYDMDIRNVEGDKFEDKSEELRVFYKESMDRNEYVPELDKEKLVLDYRENHIDVWSNIVVFRGY